MADQWDTDHAAPFHNVPCETDGAAAERIAGIGRLKLRNWYDRTRHYTHPGDSGCEDAFSVALDLFSKDKRGEPGEITAHVLDIWRRWELAVEEGPDGGQAVIPGMEREPLRQTLERHMAEPIRPTGAVKRCDIGLFETRADQDAMDL